MKKARVWPGENARIEYCVSKAFGHAFNVQVRSSFDEGADGVGECLTLRAPVTGVVSEANDYACDVLLLEEIVKPDELDAGYAESEEFDGYTYVNVTLVVQAHSAEEGQK